MSPLKKSSLLLVAVISFALILETGCATKKYVKQQVDPVSGRVDELTEVTKRNENAIKDVDSRAQSGIQSVQTKANEVDQKATTANQKAEQATQLAQNNQTQITKIEGSVNTVNQKLGNIDNYKPVETASVGFKFDRADLTDEAKATLDQLAGKVKDSRGYVLEIQGFTDKSGADKYNLTLSQRRSESVIRYLAQQHQIPLFRMFILGLGESKEIEDQKTRQGRAANRRVEITLLKSGEGTEASSGQ